MKNELTPFVAGQIIVLKNGTLLYVVDVAPPGDDRSRNCSCRLAHIYKKDEQFKKGGVDIGIVEDGRNNQIIAIDMSKMVNYTVAQLLSLTAISLGKLSDDKMRTFQKIANDVYERNGW